MSEPISIRSEKENIHLVREVKRAIEFFASQLRKGFATHEEILMQIKTLYGDSVHLHLTEALVRSLDRSLKK